jgi:hypothetical protein
MDEDSFSRGILRALTVEAYAEDSPRLHGFIERVVGPNELLLVGMIDAKGVEQTLPQSARLRIVRCGTR